MARDFNAEFIDAMREEADAQQASGNGMAKVNYHGFYLAQEAIERARKYIYVRPQNKAKAVQLLIKAAVSLMGEFNKQTGHSNG